MSQITLKIKSLGNIVKTIQVVRTDKIGSKIDDIRNLFEYKSDSIIKVIFCGKVLKDDSTFEENNIKATGAKIPRPV
jgi:hypothetical protein